MKISINLDKLRTYLFLFPYFSMLFVGLMMPSDGNHGLLAPKSLSFITSFSFLFGYFLLKRRLSYDQVNLMCSIGALVVGLLFWLFIGFLDHSLDFSVSLDQFKIFLITIFFVLMTLYIVSESFVTEEKVIKMMIYANLFYSLMKLILISMHLLQWINLFAFMESIDMRFMSMEMASGLSRFQTSVDIVTPFFIFFVLQSERLKLNLSRSFKICYIVISCFSILFSFSRFLMGVGVLSGILYGLTLNRKGVIKGLILSLFGFIFLVLMIGVENFIYMVEKRFFSLENYHSDLTRTIQINALVEKFFEAPFFGAGLGGYVKDLVRDGGILHSYEVQWIAFLMQFGVIGLLFLLIPLLTIMYQFLSWPLTFVRCSFMSLFIIWLLSGFTNPFLISLASGIIYSLFLLSASILNRKTEEKPLACT